MVIVVTFATKRTSAPHSSPEIQDNMINFNPNIIPPVKGAYLVGGAVRDILARKIPDDFDFTVRDNPRKFAMALGENTGCPVIKLGKPGLILYRIVSPLGVFDVSPMVGSNIHEDLANRDFTINAMALSVDSGGLIDPFHGQEDLIGKKIRMVSELSFVNDPIRMLRAFRFSALFSFTIDRLTEKAIVAHRSLASQSAGERVHTEIKKIFATKNAFKTVAAMAENGLLFTLFPELAPLKNCAQNRHHDFDVLEHTLLVLKHIEELLTGFPPFSDMFTRQHHWPMLKYAALFHDTGKPSCQSEKDGQIHFYGHETESAALFLSMADRLKFSNDEKKHGQTVIQNHLRPLFLFDNFRSGRLSARSKTRLFMDCGQFTPDVLLHGLADSLSKRKDDEPDTKEEFMRFVREMAEDYVTRHLPALDQSKLITGRDLIREYGLTPSPQFRAILGQVEEARLAGLISTRKEAGALVKKLLENPDAHSRA